MLARLWRSALLALVLVATLWLIVCVSTGHWIIGLAGALAILCAHAAVLAGQFVVMRSVNRTDPAPPARIFEVLRAWVIETLLGVLVFGWRQPFFERAVPDMPHRPGRRGIVFIHGYLCNRALWLPWFERLRRHDVPYVSVSLEPVFAPIDAYVPQIEDAVRRIERATGLPPVLVCHSMGGLVARAWLRWQAKRDAPSPGHGDERVHHVITIGSPHHGTWTAQAANSANGQQMRIGNPWLLKLEASETRERRSRFTCFYSHCDNIVFPASMAVLADARAQHIRACPHVQLAYEPVVMDTALHWVGVEPAKPLQTGAGKAS